MWAGKAEQEKKTLPPPHGKQLLILVTWTMMKGVGAEAEVWLSQRGLQPSPSQGTGPRTHQVLHAHGLQRVVPLGRLSRQHDAVGSVQNCIGYVAALSPGGTGLLDHALQHLEGDRASVRHGLGCL